MENGEPVVLENSEGARTTPSVVAFTKTGERLVGQRRNARRSLIPPTPFFPSSASSAANSPKSKPNRPAFPYKIVEAKNGDAHIEVDVKGEKKVFSPEEISSFILAKLKSDAEAKLGEKITQAVITVPAYFNDSQRHATRTPAASRASKSCASSTSRPRPRSPTASRRRRTKRSPSMTGRRHVRHFRARDRRRRLRGQGHQRRHAPRRRRLGQRHHGLAPGRLQGRHRHRFKRSAGRNPASERGVPKRRRSPFPPRRTYEINLPFITADQTGPKHIRKDLTRAKLEQLTDSLTERTIKPVQACLADAKIAASQGR